MDQPRRTAGGSAREVFLLHERSPEPAERRVTCDAGTGDAAADHEKVEWRAGEGVQAGSARLYGRKSGGQGVL
jgi:hypothetical protein